MSDCPFCTVEPTPNPPPAAKGIPPSSMERHPLALVPSLLLAFMPKCPMCIVAYVALFTGLGISVATAHWMQIFLWAFCLILFAYLAITRIALFRRS